MKSLKTVFRVGMFVCVFVSCLFIINQGNMLQAAEYAVKTAQLPSRIFTHGGGTVYYPADNARHGVVLIMPGFMETQSYIQWYGPMLAKNGFVAVTMDSLTRADLPSSRARQLAAALKDVKSRFKTIVDPARAAYMGHSMGGGGTLDAAVKDPGLKAIIPIAPWHDLSITNATVYYGQIQVPTLIISCAADLIAPNLKHSDVFYNAIGSAKKMQITMSGGLHSCANTDGTVPVGIEMDLAPNDQYKPAITHFVVSWLRYFMDGESVYLQDLCGPGADQPEVESSRNNFCE
ncbi:MAG: dienelactone hydrolase family protein [Thermodesulfobacteriota bacterium]